MALLKQYEEFETYAGLAQKVGFWVKIFFTG
jgi:hypothetical protein